MSCNECEKNDRPYTIVGAMELDVDDLSTTPDYFLGIRTLLDPSTSSIKATPVRIPGARVMPTGSLANVAAVLANNTAITVPEGQVRAGYIDTQPGGNIMRYADKNHKAMFLIVGEYADEKKLVQTTGFLTIPEGHRYIVGQQYYLGEDGQPTTDSSTTGQKLFMPINDIILNVNGDF